MKKRASIVSACVFTGTSYTKVFTGDGLNLGALTNNEYQAYNEANEAAFVLASEFPDAKFEVKICPYDYDQNVVVLNQLGIQMNLPAIVITGTYSVDGQKEQRQYILKGVATGTKTWDRQEVYNHMRALYENEFGTGEESLLCKFFPPLCKLGAYVWLAATAVSVYKTVESKGNPALQTLWGASSLLCGETFIKKGGIKALTKKNLRALQ